MILTDREIQIALDNRLIRIDPPPDRSTALTSTAVDLTLDESLRISKTETPGLVQVIDPTAPNYDTEEAIEKITDALTIPNTGFDLVPKTFVLAWTREFVSLPVTTKIAARVEGRSSLARLGLGVHVTAPTIHAGFANRIRLEMINHGIVPIRLRPGMRICQLIFEATLGTPEKGYQGQFLKPMKISRKTATAE